jgi:hypothetical protein
MSGTVGAALEADAYGIPSIAASIAAHVSEWRTFGTIDWTAARHFTRLLARQVLDEGMPDGVSVFNLNVPRSATPQTELRRTTQSRQPYYVRSRPSSGRRLDQPYEFAVEVVVDWDRLEPGTDIHAVVRDQVASVTPLTWRMTADTDWVPAAGSPGRHHRPGPDHSAGCRRPGRSGRAQGTQYCSRDLDRSAAAHLGEHPDGEIFTSLPRPGHADWMLAEWGDCRQAYDGPDSVAALAGCTPVTKESGKHRAVHFRWACNKRFRQAMTTFAGNSRHASPWAAQIYDNARASGKDHPHAIRILARAWIRVIWPCWLNHTPYDPARHGAAAVLIKPGAA